MHNPFRGLFKPCILLGMAALLLAGCDDDDDNGAATSASFEIEVTNLTASQPLSPLAIVAHSPSYRLFSTGEAAGAGLEVMAEGGDNADLLLEAMGDSTVFETAAGSAALAPGDSETLTITASRDNLAELQISVTSMLVNTNDAFIALNGGSVADLAVNGSQVFDVIAYDAGTEANTEAAGTLPGPADGGQGFNIARDDISNTVSAHIGVVTSDDGLASSILTHEHRWDNPVARIRITRTE